MGMKKSTRYSTGRLMAEMRDTRYENGSALILAVVLTSLLAVLGMMFVMVARVDRIATSAISENKDLDSAVEAVIAKISQELVSDVPGIGGQPDYYDYPDVNNAWLASLEPYDSGGYKWHQISDVTGYLERENCGTADIEINSDAIIEDHKEIELDDDGDIETSPEQLADADGDGVADSKWIELDDISSNKGRAIYAAIRVIDNGAMINVNTAYKFDPTESRERIDGSSQMQINLLALAQRNIASDAEDLNDLDEERFGSESRNMDNYLWDVVWRYNEPDGEYTPFDISDELELRNRYTLNRSDIDSRIEEVWDSAFHGDNYLRTPVDSSSSLGDWEEEVYFDDSEPNASDNYSYRHIGTTYNMDRIIRPDGEKMLNINDANAVYLYKAIKSALDPNNVPNRDAVAAQLAVNIKDFHDNDSEVNTVDADSGTYYGFEAQPFISELGIIIDAVNPDNDSEYALELYNPFDVNIPLDDFTLSIGADISLSGDINAKGYYVIASDLSAFTIAPGAATLQDSNLKFSGNYIPNPTPPPNFTSWDNYNITLKRTVSSADVVLDRQDTDNGWFTPDTTRYVQRDRDNWQFVYENERDDNATNTLGSINAYNGASGTNYNLAIANSDFITIGDISKVLRVGPSTDPCDTIGEQLDSATSEAEVRIDLADDPDYHNLFQYLTVFDPASDNIDNDGDGFTDELTPPPIGPAAGDELKVPGRININTAPWFVIAQLPWMTSDIAQAVVSYRDDQDGFESIGELTQVVGMDCYADGNDLDVFPDLTPGDGAIDDFEERDVIFARISNLVTVRSDVFTAYILVRIGADGPQKRVIAILDRSDVYPPDGGKVRIVALHPVADPR